MLLHTKYFDIKRNLCQTLYKYYYVVLSDTFFGQITHFNYCKNSMQKQILSFLSNLNRLQSADKNLNNKILATYLWKNKINNEMLIK